MLFDFEEAAKYFVFFRCIVQFLMNLKERGWKTGVGISFFTLFISFGIAFMVKYGIK